MEEHPIQGLMTTAMENLKDMIEVNTIIGDPVESPDGSVIIPVSKVGFGFAAGGTEFMPSSSGSQGDSEGGGSGSEAVFPFGGGSGGGVSITPVAFLIVSPKGIKMVHLDENTHIYEKIIDFAPKAVEKIQQLLKESKMGKGSHGEDKGKKKDESKGKEKEKEDKQPDEKKDSDDKDKSDSEESSSIYDI
ncbi:GerW family sporulation protein [Paucisalibacillus sp. EB02]|uniref:GerW family sporulation protein n=1 Tax=Paucisalibacillus sp. EB02 TaxID=1347087 RepID=UPI0004B75059|nr:GerW family sporulation protein [Paucisalibacillus sp. EB02]